MGDIVPTGVLERHARSGLVSKPWPPTHLGYPIVARADMISSKMAAAATPGAGSVGK